MSTLKVNNLQVGQDSTATNNLTWFQPGSPDGTIRLGSGNAGSATTKFTFDKDGNLTCVGDITANSIIAPIEGTLDDWIVHAGDTNTKIGFPDVDEFEIHAGGGPRLRIDSSGRVLINQTDVGAKSAPAHLQLVSSTSGAFGLNISMRSNNDYGFITYTDHDASEDLVQLGVQRTASDAGDLIIYTNDGNTSGTERLRIKSDGVITSSTTHPQVILKDPSNRQVSLRSPSTSNNAALGTDSNHDLIFYTNGYSNERLRITSNGKFLISGEATLNSTSLAHPLQVRASNVADAIAVIGRTADDIGELSFYEADKSTKLGELQYRRDHLNFRHRVGYITFCAGGTAEKIRITSNGELNIGGNYTQTTVPLAVTTSANDFGIRLLTGTNAVCDILNNDSTGNCEIRGYYNNNSGTRGEGFRLESSGDSFFMGGRLLVGTTAQSISTSELFEVKSATHGFSYFENNSSAGYAPIYINAKYSNTAHAPCITITDGGGNRGGIGLDSAEYLRVHGQGGVDIWTGGTVGGGTQKWRINNVGDLSHTFAGRHGQMIGSTDGSGAYIMLDGAEGNPLSSGTDYMYMEHTSTGQFEMWNGKGGVSTTKFMDVSPQGAVSMPRQPTSHAYGTLSFTDWNTYEYVSFGSQSLEYPSALNPWDGGGIFTVPAGGAGLYLLTASFLMPSNASGNDQYLLWGFFKNTGGVNLWQQDYFTSTNKVASSAAVIVQAAVGDTFRVALHKSYGRPYSSGYNFFMVTKIS